jgi:hypothetical protein
MPVAPVMLLRRHNDLIAGSHIDHKEILKGMKNLSGQRVGTVYVPPLIFAPTGAVVNGRT